MLPGSVDPRRPDKQQRYKPPPASNQAAPGEDLTPDYMNILDPQRKSMQTRSDRFKVVKIESTEPFKRGRWECMDFLDQSYNRVFLSLSRQVSNDTQTPLTSPEISPNNSQLQSSMLQIFYRQNSSIFDSISTPQPQASNQNHILRPGMVSASLVGIKYPFESNFEGDSTSHSNCKTCPSTISDCQVLCDNQKFQSMTSDFSNLSLCQNINQDVVNAQYIQNTVQPPQNYMYQGQRVAYVDNCYSQQSVNNIIGDHTTSNPNFPTEFYQNSYNNPNNYNHQLNEQLTQVIQTPIPNDTSQVLYYPNPSFQDHLITQTESQTQNVCYQNHQNNSVISINSFDTMNHQQYVQNNYIPQETQKPPVSNNVGQPTMTSAQQNPLLLPIINSPSRCLDVKNLIAVTSSNANSRSIDDKIEQLMDLVKKHLKFAILEDVNVMKQQILILKGRVAQLEYENAILKSYETSNRPRDDI